ncbi:MAG: hypothetical protein WA212_04485 [Candidatus Acidiferrales bacterium]
MNHNIPSWGNLLSVQSQYFAEASPDSVAPDRVPQRLFYAPAESAACEAIGT